MLRRLLLTLSLACLNSGCISGVEVQVCVSDPVRGGFQCYNKRTEKESFVKFEDSNGYISFTPEDAQKLLNACSKR